MKMRLAVVGASHWHAPLMMAGLDAAAAEVAAVWDYDEAVARRFVRKFGGAVFAALEDLHEVRGLDAVLVLAEPADMPVLARPFIERGTPVVLEKPGAARLADLVALGRAAARTGTPVAVPLVQRAAGVGKALLELAAGDRVTGAAFQFIAGGPQRYRRAGCGFMLDPARSGGGAMLNLGVHFVDLAMALAGAPVREAAGFASNALWGEAVEDHAAMILRFAGGAVATVEAGYAFPDHSQRRLFTATLSTGRVFARFDGTALRVFARNGTSRTVAVEAETDRYYADFLVLALDAFRTGRPPLTGLAEMEAAYRAIEVALRPPIPICASAPIRGAAAARLAGAP